MKRGFSPSLHPPSFPETFIHKNYFRKTLTSGRKYGIIFQYAHRDIAKSVKAQDFDSCISFVRVQLSLPQKYRRRYESLVSSLFFANDAYPRRSAGQDTIWSDGGIIICTAIIITTQPDLLKHDFIKSSLKHQTCVYYFFLKGKV